MTALRNILPRIMRAVILVTLGMLTSFLAARLSTSRTAPCGKGACLVCPLAEPRAAKATSTEQRSQPKAESGESNRER